MHPGSPFQAVSLSVFVKPPINGSIVPCPVCLKWKYKYFWFTVNIMALFTCVCGCVYYIRIGRSHWPFICYFPPKPWLIISRLIYLYLDLFCLFSIAWLNSLKRIDFNYKFYPIKMFKLTHLNVSPLQFTLPVQLRRIRTENLLDLVLWDMEVFPKISNTVIWFGLFVHWTLKVESNSL